MKKIIFLPVLLILSVGLGFFSNSYADQYIDNLHDQMIRHLEVQGYHFTNIGDEWHTIKPMETICGEVIKPKNSDQIDLRAYYYGEFRKEYAIQYYKSINNILSYPDGYGGEWVYTYPLSQMELHVTLDKSATEGKICIKNISRHANLSVVFKLNSIPVIK